MSDRILHIFIWSSSLLNIGLCVSHQGRYPNVNTVPWPLPHSMRSEQTYWLVNTANWSIVLNDVHCPIVNGAISRLKKALSDKICTYPDPLASIAFVKEASGFLSDLRVQLVGPCQYMPELYMSEQYVLKIGDADDRKRATLISDSNWGILHGLQTFHQLLYPVSRGVFAINSTIIHDHPVFSHRGLMIDTSNHYISVATILRILDLMAVNKMNVLHWHIVGDRSFPFYSSSLPNLSNKGAFHRRSHVYLPADIVSIVSFSQQRGIRVIPEFDTPGHTTSWGKGYPQLLRSCSSPEQSGSIDPTRETTYGLLAVLLTEVGSLFPDSYLHLGGRNFNATCWNSDASVSKFLNRSGMKDAVFALKDFHFKRLFQISQAIKKIPILWQDVISNGVRVPHDSVIQSYENTADIYLEKLFRVGRKVLLSSCWNLSSSADWEDFYDCNLREARDKKTRSLVLGGEAWIMSDAIDGTNIISQAWTRSSAAAEKLWNPDGGSADSPDVADRLHNFRCFMLQRGYPASPIRFGFCPCDIKF
ncbi:beta-hexosaminidase subunit alpha-like isoform X2 [Ornithodoros turicata]|uniref:beta-hexosaminidase subunit alpha-like isoform X2 n=1 Tax=Ornithodoros turicata TaxID=34597 RepID=UPI0031395851